MNSGHFHIPLILFFWVMNPDINSRIPAHISRNKERNSCGKSDKNLMNKGENITSKAFIINSLYKLILIVATNNLKFISSDFYQILMPFFREEASDSFGVVYRAFTI